MSRVLRDKWHRASNVGELQYTLDECTVELHSSIGADIDQWVDEFCYGSGPVKGLLLSGNPGSGKTTLAKAICHAVIEKASLRRLGRTPEMVPHWPVYFAPYTSYISDVQRRMSLDRRGLYDSQEYDNVDLRVISLAAESREPEWEIKLAVLDDIGAEYSAGTGWVEQELNKILRSRGAAGLTTIATTNLELEAWEDRYGLAASSYAHEAFTEVIIAGKDRRK